jgi:murein DD-endopeptidase / murein LD-carboxypeptidase
MRRGDADAVASLIAAAGLARVDDPAAGDLLLMRSGPGRLHLAIEAPGGIVHADAGLGRVVERPGPPPWPVLARFRRED